MLCCQTLAFPVAVVLGAVLVNVGGRGIRAVFVYQQENKGLSSKDVLEGCFGAATWKNIPWVLGSTKSFQSDRTADKQA